MHRKVPLYSCDAAGDAIGEIELFAFDFGGEAECTSRVVGDGLQEWAGPGTMSNGTDIKVYWIFSDEDRAGKEPEDYPWEDSISHVVLLEVIPA